MSPLKNAIAVLLYALALAACSRVWYLSIAATNSSTPVLCFSAAKNCRGDGVQFYSIDISEVNKKGEAVSVAWSIQGKSNRTNDYVLKRLTYGVLPNGWIEKEPARRLQPGKFYSVEEEFYFTTFADGTSKILTRERFFQDIEYSQEKSK